MMVKKITAKEFEDCVASGVALIDFSAEWCGPCKMLAPVLEEVSEQLEGKMNFFNVDVDANQKLAQEYGIMNIPALLILKDGEKAGMEVGFQPKDVLLEKLQQYI